MSKATIEADPNLPTITITRDFDAPRDRVFRAFTDKAIVEKWLGPDDAEMEIDKWDCRTGGGFQYAAKAGGATVAGFFGSFHEVREPERIVQTFTWDGEPDGVSLDTMTFEDLGDGRTRTVGVSVVSSMEAREAMLGSGMEVGVDQGYAKLDKLLAAGA